MTERKIKCVKEQVDSTQSVLTVLSVYSNFPGGWSFISLSESWYVYAPDWYQTLRTAINF